MSEPNESSRGVTFFDKYSPIKFLTADDDRGYKEGDIVFVGGENKIYGPYQLDKEIGRGNGHIHWKAIALNGGSKQAAKPLTKTELEQENVRLLTELETLRSQATVAANTSTSGISAPGKGKKSSKVPMIPSPLA